MSEQTRQNNLFSKEVTLLDKYTCYNLGATTIADLIKTGELNKAIKVKSYTGKKPDVLFVDRNKNVVIFIECKLPEEFNTPAKIQKAIDQEIEVAKEIKAKIYVVTDCSSFIWINPLTGKRILNVDGSEVIKEINPKVNEKELVDFIEDVVLSINDTNNQILKKEELNPTDLAVKIAGILKRMTFSSAKESLYTFVEVFLFKYLSDIGILAGKFSFDYIYKKYSDPDFTAADVLQLYMSVREQMKTLFPEGKDGTTIINGLLFHLQKDDKDKYITDSNGHHISPDNSDEIFKNILDEFKAYEKKNGKFINISRDFKSKLFETFMKNSDDKTDMGQFFTPLKVVQEMVSMVDITEGMKICDPACGVGKFLLESISENPEILKKYSYNVGTKTLTKGVEIFGFEKTMSNKNDITTILSKANMLIYFSKLFTDNNDPSIIPELSEQLLNETFKTSMSQLGTLEHLEENKYDLILANPPYYRDGKISKLAKDTGYYDKGGQGIEGLFLEWIIKSLKPNGVANIVLPDGIFSNTGNKKLKQYLLDCCDIKCIISLPTKTFFTTPKKTYILTIKKKDTVDIGKIQTSKVFCYICKTIGETLDTYRFDIEDNDLHSAVNKFNAFKKIKDINKIEEPYKSWFENDKKLKLIDISTFDSNESWIIDKLWSDEDLIELGFKEREKTMTIDEFSTYITDLIKEINGYKEVVECLKL